MSIISNIRGAECVICACSMIAAVPTVLSRQLLSVTLLMNNINSIRRESPGNKSLYEATTDKSIFRLMELMDLRGSCRFI